MVFARVGVGVATGKIQVKEPLKAGKIYLLPTLVVSNTGTEPSWYEPGIEYHEGQETNPDMGLKPPREWFSFEPAEFYLEPGQAQKVEIRLTVPLKAKPGDYFCYLEGRSLRKDTGTGGAKIGVAAAAQVYFIILPANIWQAIYYRVSDLMKIYSPWSWVVLWLIIGAIVILILRAIFKRFFKLQIGITKK